MGWRVFSRRMVPVGNRVVIVLGAGYRGIGVSGIGYRGDSRCWGVTVLGIGYRVSGGFSVLGCYGIGAGMGARWISTGTRIFSPLKGHGIYSGFQLCRRYFDNSFHCLRHFSHAWSCD